MKINIESTSKIIEINGIPARVWEGKTESGIPVHCFIPRVAVSKDEHPETLDLFQKELQEVKPPSVDVQSYPLRMIL